MAENIDRLKNDGNSWNTISLKPAHEAKCFMYTNTMMVKIQYDILCVMEIPMRASFSLKVVIQQNIAGWYPFMNILEGTDNMDHPREPWIDEGDA